MFFSILRRFSAVLLLVLPQAARAGDGPGLDHGDNAWVLISAALVLMMTLPGLALFYGGMVRKKNLLSTMMHSIAITGVMTLLWMVAGYSLVFTPGNAFVGGFDRLMLNGLTVDSVAGRISESTFVLFQMTFAIITPAVIAGAVAERMKFSALLWFMILWSLIVYVPIAHMAWGPGGLFATMGLMDYAGGTVVEINSGVSALVVCIVLGPRLNYRIDNMAPHNLGLSVLGGGLLWVGWFGFNAGSALAADGRAGMAALTSQIAGAAAALSWTAVEWWLHEKPSILGILSGAIAGLVAITPAAGFVDPAGALVIGLTAGVVCLFAATTMKRRLGYDDSLDVFGIHGVAGLLGTLLTGVFARAAICGTAGALEGNWHAVQVQAFAIAVTVAYSAVASFVLIKLVDVAIGLRTGRDAEREGLDIALHGESVL